MVRSDQNQKTLVANNLRAIRAGVGKIKTKAQVAMVVINKAKTRSKKGWWSV